MNHFVQTSKIQSASFNLKIEQENYCFHNELDVQTFLEIDMKGLQ